MRFTFKAYKKTEFESTLRNIIMETDENKAGHLVDYTNDGEMVYADINDNKIARMSKGHIDLLRNL